MKGLITYKCMYMSSNLIGGKAEELDEHFEKCMNRWESEDVLSQ